MKFLTIIKGISERLRDKNFLEFGGMPLWEYSLKNLGAEEVFINTDAPEKLNSNGLSTAVHLIAREQRHIDWESQAAERGSPVNSILGSFFRDFVVDGAEPVVLFHVTSPFLRMESVMQAIERLDRYASVSSVQRVQDFAWLDNGSGPQPINFDASRVSRTQDLPSIFLSRGAFFIVSKDEFMKTQTRNPEPHGFFELDPIQALEIDTPEDYELAKIVAKGLHHL